MSAANLKSRKEVNLVTVNVQDEVDHWGPGFYVLSAVLGI